MLLNIYTGEQARDTPYEIEILIPVDGYDPIGFTLTKLCGYISRGRRKKREKKREKKRKNLEIRRRRQLLLVRAGRRSLGDVAKDSQPRGEKKRGNVASAIQVPCYSLADYKQGREGDATSGWATFGVLSCMYTNIITI
ncbi:hypothetical protein B296_00056331 [Ensete ventricosum]|uniref:Uncharacterized protein n=1 Tax=Ensete ventricosum TaxID=4639 RepID=A0A426XVM0_ENSVE|nr:hypothetical protein B296_00056331 [Ensete ventricosum]